jgi:hypothetical protein
MGGITCFLLGKPYFVGGADGGVRDGSLFLENAAAKTGL